ncbi:hypothetical protein V1477_009968 [Vespula maculifrons]|uniref:Uncharacterized protein n=1 Tax=Vespula maculifrons TaxID=7453 RepID=A0ABD2CBJ9_VESMC
MPTATLNGTPQYGSSARGRWIDGSGQELPNNSILKNLHERARYIYEFASSRQRKLSGPSYRYNIMYRN